MTDLNRLDKRVGDLESTQAATTQAFSDLKEQLTKHIDRVTVLIDKDDRRHEVQQETLLTLVQKVDNLNSLKIQQETNTKEITTVKATQKSHTWFIRAIIGVVILATLSGVVGTIGTCTSINGQVSSDTVRNKAASR
jgi:hypothetical protein